MSNHQIEIDYTNHRGDRRLRKIIPVGSLMFTSNQWHTTEQWLFNAIDGDSGEVKTFALSGINSSIAGDRSTELLTSNNELLQRARDAEDREKALLNEVGNLRAQLGVAQALNGLNKIDIEVKTDPAQEPVVEPAQAP